MVTPFGDKPGFIIGMNGGAMMIDNEGNIYLFPSKTDSDGVEECDACRIEWTEDQKVKSDAIIRDNGDGTYDMVWASDQKAKSDAGKPKLTLVPRQIIFDICAVREYGSAKYPDGGPDNWKQVDVQRYRDALYRHFMAYLDDPKSIDPESGIPHYMHMACNMAFICELEKEDEE